MNFLLTIALLFFCVGCNAEVGPQEVARSTNTAAEDVDVFLLAGQSNMEGVGRVESLSPAELNIPNVHLFHSSAIGAKGQNDKWIPLSPAGWKGTLTGGFGVEMSLGAALSRAHPKRQIYLIKHAVGGTALFDSWHPSAGTEFRTFCDLVERAIKELKAKGLRPIVRGMFWQQGEADARTKEKAQLYRSRLENFIVRIRAKMSAMATEGRSANIRFVLGQVIPDLSARAAKTYPYREEIRSAQLAVARELTNVVTVPTDVSFETHASDADGYRDQDNIHFNGVGLKKLGRFMAAAYLRNDASPDSSPAGSARKAQASPPNTLRVATYNSYYVFGNGKQVDAATKWIASQAQDIIALQELTTIKDERLGELAAGWGHEHSVLLKTSGFSVGVTSVLPIETIEKMTDGLHHGCLHVRIAGIHIFVVHLSPFLWAKRQAETKIILARIRPLLAQDADVLVLGDFNALSSADRSLLKTRPAVLQKAQTSDAKHGHIENLRDGKFDFSVMENYFEAGLEDAALPFLEQRRAQRWTFPTDYFRAHMPETILDDGTRIDFILANRSLAAAAVSARVARQGVVKKTSDHYPVLIEFHRPGLK